MSDPDPALPNDTKFYILIAFALCLISLLVYLGMGWYSLVPAILIVALFRGNWPKLPF